MIKSITLPIFYFMSKIRALKIYGIIYKYINDNFYCYYLYLGIQVPDRRSENAFTRK